jgi:uncharacterized membrane protein YoaK (UPF0700 family)
METGSLGRVTAFGRMMVGHRRSDQADFALATVLAALAGAANAGGFFALGQYTSHMTGYLSQLADNLVILGWKAVFVSCLAASAFVAGAAFSTVLINWARQRDERMQYALPLAVQGAFMVAFGFGGMFTGELWRLFSLSCLCFIMGMQNATITKISGARIRTTHVTGMVTDIGIEIGRAVFGLAGTGVRADPEKLRILLRLVGAFVGGGVVGATGYGHLGFYFSWPLAFVLLSLSLPALLKPR